MSQVENSPSPAPAEKPKFKSSYRSQRMPRETQVGLAIIGSLIVIFGWVLYQRLTRPAEMDAEQYVASNPVSNTTTTPPATLNPTTAGTTAPLTMPSQAGSAPLTQTDPFASRPGPTIPANTIQKPPHFELGAAPAALTASSAAPAPTLMPGMANNTTEPKTSFLPPADQVEPTAGIAPGTLQIPGNAAPIAEQPAMKMPNTSPQSGSDNTVVAVTENPLAAPAAALQESTLKIRDQANQLNQQLQDQGNQLVNAGRNTLQQAEQAGNAAAQTYNDATQAVTNLGQQADQFRQSATELTKNAGDTARQLGTNLQAEASQQAIQFTNTLRNTAGEQLQKTQDQFRNTTNQLVNETTNNVRSGIDQTLNNTRQQLGNSLNQLAGSAASTLAPLQPQPGTAAAPNPFAPRQLDAAQTKMAQPLAPTQPTQPEPAIRIPAESSQPLMAQPNPGASRTSFDTPAATQPMASKHIVQPGESFYSVAERYYGNGQFNRALFEYNRRYNPGELQIGGTMLVPDLQTLRTQFSDLLPTANPTANANPFYNR